MSDPTKEPTQDPITGAWTYPPGEEWASPDLRLQLESVSGELIARTREHGEAVVKAVAALTSPAAFIALKRLEVDAAKRAVERLRRETAGELAWRMARAKHGDDVERLDTVEGDVLIMLAMNEAEVEHVNKRAQSLADAHRKALAKGADEATALAAEARALTDYIGAQHDAIKGKTTVGGLDAKASRERLDYLTKRYSGLWVRLRMIRESLTLGFRVREGKDFAP